MNDYLCGNSNDYNCTFYKDNYIIQFKNIIIIYNKLIGTI